MPGKNVILDKSFDFALHIIDYCDKLDTNNKYAISNQLLKAGTSIGANVNEAQNAESKLDFIHKFKIAAKEADETDYWLRLCKCATSYPDTDDLLLQLQELKKIICTIIAKTKSSIK